MTAHGIASLGPRAIKIALDRRGVYRFECFAVNESPGFARKQKQLASIREQSKNEILN